MIGRAMGEYRAISAEALKPSQKSKSTG